MDFSRKVLFGSFEIFSEYPLILGSYPSSQRERGYQFPNLSDNSKVVSKREVPPDAVLKIITGDSAL